MTREEIRKAMRDTKKEVVLKNLHKLLSLVEGYPEYEDCVGYAIKALEQEPILNKIRAEIENHCSLTKENHCRYCSYCNNVMGVREILEIIDKYKADSESQESEE